MEVDTGASWTLVSKATFNCLWPNRELQALSVQLSTYTGEHNEVLGMCSFLILVTHCIISLL